jgi:hypothetical protein
MNRLIYFCLGILLFSCGQSGSIAGDVVVTELKRIISDDKKVEAVLVETGTGATSGSSPKVFIVKPGTKITIDNLNYSVFTCDHSAGEVKILWKANKQLLITYNKARIFHFTNFWNSNEVDNFDYNVDIDLKRDTISN